jgi:hypothetical protein
MLLTRNSTIVEEGDVENINSGGIGFNESKKIILTESYAKALLGDEY